jgi:hypothetical protein
MIEQQKAKELIFKFKNNVYLKAFSDTDFMYDRYYGLNDEMAKQCALIAIDEILTNNMYFKDSNNDKYWNNIKLEIENI